ncbi:MAG TPA: hypothetical protein PKA54_00680 [Chitinophagaceae bacterium]|nr:hypothetical protein [Chitinophagaceae bacterium]
MMFKIDTKEKIEIICPQFTNLELNMAEDLCKISLNAAQSGKSVIIDFSNIESIENTVVYELEKNYQTLYEKEVSSAYCCMKKNLIPHFYSIQNIVPTLEEAIDIVSMEGLERELFADE